MAPSTRKAKPAPTAVPKLDLAAQHNDPFERTFYVSSSAGSENDSDHSEFASRKRKRTSKSRRKQNKKGSHSTRGTAPQAPDMTDEEVEEMEDDGPLWGLRSKGSPWQSSLTQPEILRLEVNGTPGQSTTIELNLKDILLRNDKPTNLLHSQGLTLSKHHAATRAVSRPGTDGPIGFLHLPYELRVRVYRRVLVAEAPINFVSRDGFGRTSALLRVCRSVHEESREILYGENSYHFERTEARRGKYWEKTWKEVGFKDVRRFLTDIGPINISHLKYVSLQLADAPPGLTPELDLAQRKYVNDPVLHQILNMMGSYATLTKLAVAFSGRAQVQIHDYHFLKAFTSIRCRKLIHAHTMGCSRISEILVDKMTTVMELSRAAEDPIDSPKAKKVRMYHEKPSRYGYTGFTW